MPMSDPYEENVIVQVASGRSRRGLRLPQPRRGRWRSRSARARSPASAATSPARRPIVTSRSTRMIPAGIRRDLSPAPHHDIYSIEDLRQLHLLSIKEATGYKPVGVKIAAVHNVAAIASGIVRAGADYVYIDGSGGGTGAAPQAAIRDHVGIPLEIAVAVVDQRLQGRGHPPARLDHRRRLDSLVCGPRQGDRPRSRRRRHRLGCTYRPGLPSLRQGCHTGSCSWGLTTHKPGLTRRLDPEWGAERLVNHGVRLEPRAPGGPRRSRRGTPSSRCEAAATGCAVWAWTRKPARSSA